MRAPILLILIFIHSLAMAKSLVNPLCKLQAVQATIPAPLPEKPSWERLAEIRSFLQHAPALSPKEKLQILIDLQTAKDTTLLTTLKDFNPLIDHILSDFENHLSPEERWMLLRDPKLRIHASTYLSKSSGSLMDETLDAVIGLRIAKTEKSITDLVKSEKGLAKWGTSFRRENTGYYQFVPNVIKAYLTPYSDIEFQIQLAQLKAGESVCDLGTAYARPGMVIGINHPQNKFIGVEITAARLKEAERASKELRFKNVSLHAQDISSSNFKLPVSDVYFLYDPVNDKTLALLMKQFKALAKSGHSFRIVAREGGGDFLANLEKHRKSWFTDWLYPIHREVGQAAAKGIHTEDVMLFSTDANFGKHH